VAVIHALHLLNVWLLWLLIRRLGATVPAAALACLFFGLHMALFDNFWKPMYVFDILCAAFCLLSLLAWTHSPRTHSLWTHSQCLASFIAFWLAYKSKELAVMLPLVLAAYEVFYGRRRWKPLVPFFLVSLSFGVQSILMNPNRDNDYTFRFTAAALAKTSVFYAGRLFLIPYLGFAALLLARYKRAWFGLAMMGLFFLPMLFLPGRIFSAYCYLPFTGLAIAMAGAAEAASPAALALFLLLWAPMDVRELRCRRSDTLARDNEVRLWMAAAGRFAESHPKADAFVFSGAPAGFQRWGVEGALKYFYGRNDLVIRYIDDPDAPAIRAARRTAMLTWDAARRRLDIVY
jgi:hypothetical protein